MIDKSSTSRRALTELSFFEQMVQDRSTLQLWEGNYSTAMCIYLSLLPSDVLLSESGLHSNNLYTVSCTVYFSAFEVEANKATKTTFILRFSCVLMRTLRSKIMARSQFGLLEYGVRLT